MLYSCTPMAMGVKGLPALDQTHRVVLPIPQAWLGLFKKVRTRLLQGDKIKNKPQTFVNIFAKY